MRSKQEHPDPESESMRMIRFLQDETLVEINEERRHLKLGEIASPIFAVEGLEFCGRSEALLHESFVEGLSEMAIREAVQRSGSTCVITSELNKAREALKTCLEYGNTDVSIFDFHRSDTSLLYITWTDAGI